MRFVPIFLSFFLIGCAEFTNRSAYTPLHTVPDDVPSKDGHYDEMERLKVQADQLKNYDTEESKSGPLAAK